MRTHIDLFYGLIEIDISISILAAQAYINYETNAKCEYVRLYEKQKNISIEHFTTTSKTACK